MFCFLGICVNCPFKEKNYSRDSRIKEVLRCVLLSKGEATCLNAAATFPAIQR